MVSRQIRLREEARHYYQEHKEEKKAYARRYYQAHKHEQKEQRRIYNHQRLRRIKLEVLSHYSGGPPYCLQCGIDDLDVLCIDHIDGGGEKHRRNLGVLSGSSFYSWLQRERYPEGFQVLCANCNLKKQMREWARPTR